MQNLDFTQQHGRKPGFLKSQTFYRSDPLNKFRHHSLENAIAPNFIGQTHPHGLHLQQRKPECWLRFLQNLDSEGP